MNEAKVLRDEFEKKLKALQDSCLHEETEIGPYYWAIAHYGGEVEVCKRCEKIIRHMQLGDEYAGR